MVFQGSDGHYLPLMKFGVKSITTVRYSDIFPAQYFSFHSTPNKTGS